MTLTDDRINELNAQESDYTIEFFKNFTQNITVYEDEDIWVLDKPAGLLSVDGRILKVSLQSRLLKVNSKIKLIHRLDMDTSGLIIFAKNAAAQTHISKQFIQRLPQKEYQALVYGKMTSQNGTIDIPVRYEPTTKPRHITDISWVKQAVTNYQVLGIESKTDTLGHTHDITRVQLFPITGRSHQLRVHMLHINHVMLGDPIYAEGLALTLLPRLALHAHRLRLKHPTENVWLQWQSDVPF